MHFQNNSIIAIQVMPEHDEMKHGTFLPVGAESWNWIAYVNENLFMAYIGDANIFDRIWRIWK